MLTRETYILDNCTASVNTKLQVVATSEGEKWVGTQGLWLFCNVFLN